MSREARKGDRALVVGLKNWPEINGLIVEVLSDSRRMVTYDPRAMSSMISVVNDTELISAGGYLFSIIGTANLIPIINPDPEQATERERELAR